MQISIWTKALMLGALVIKLSGAGFPEYYYKIRNIEKQKKEFIKILLPLVNRGNEIVMSEREFAKSFFEKAITHDFRNLSTKDLGKLLYISQKYKIKNLFDKDAYMNRIDKIPVSLALSQGALESGWGKSRFTKEANNIFGHWTYSGIGLIPSSREEGKTHRIRIFTTLQGSVNAYMLNLNRNLAYKAFRKKRAEFRKKYKVYNGIEASRTMINYSQLKGRYLKILDKLINTINLLYYDSYNPAAFMDSA